VSTRFAGTWPWVWRGLLVLLLLAGWQIALAPVTSHEPDWFENADKVRHAGAFFVFWCVGAPGWARTRWLWLAGGLLCYGAAIEIAQGLLTTDRDASFADWIADALGLALGHQVASHMNTAGSLSGNCR
jgi:VanZ family protein